MKDTAYAFSVAKIRAIENSLLTSSDTELLISAKSIDDCMRILADKGYGDGETQTNFNLLLKQEMEKTWAVINEIAPDPGIFDMLLYKNDYHNLKVILKATVANTEYDDMLMSPTTVDVGLIKQAVEEGNFEKLSPDFAETAKTAYHKIMRENNAQGAAMTADKASIEAMCKAAEASHNDFFKEVANLTADCINVKTALRCAIIGKDMNFAGEALANAGTIDVNALAIAAGTDLNTLKEFIQSTSLSEGLEAFESGFSVFEKWCDDKIMQLVMKAKYKAFGPDPLLAYIYAKETEIKALHIILTGKMNKLEDEEIRRRLKLLYV